MKIQVSHISKRYQRRQILKDISFSAGEGAVVGILGPNGCGKSTLLSILAGASRAGSGSFLLEDGGRSQDLLRSPRLLASLVGYVPQTPPLLEELTARDNLSLWYPGGRKMLEEELDRGVLRRLDLGPVLKKEVSRLSGGMKKRLAIGCAVSNHPRILILDEPGAALDLVCKQVILDYLEDFRRGGGIALLASHEPQEIASCSETYLLREGLLTPYSYDGDIEKLARSL